MPAKTCNITIRMDADLKKEAEELFADLGMNLTTAFNVFVRQTIRKQRIPFDVSRDVPRPETLEAMAEAIRIESDPKVKKYTNMKDVIKGLQS